MRSAKDLKGMVKDARVRGASNNGSASNTRQAIREDVAGENSRPYDTNPASAYEGTNFVRNKQVGGAAYASAVTDDDTLKKMRKLEVLASTDKETIELM